MAYDICPPLEQNPEINPDLALVWTQVEWIMSIKGS